jgi:alpha-tubulin suppressor-like RCC1 family protein
MRSSTRQILWCLMALGALGCSGDPPSSGPGAGGSAAGSGASGGSQGGDGTGGDGGTSGTVAGTSSGGNGGANSLVGVRSHISLGEDFGCAINESGAIVCWGEPEPDYDFGQTEPPSGNYVHLSCGSTACCAVDMNQHLTCWGSIDDFSADAVASVSVGGETCFIRTTGSAVCTSMAPGQVAQISSGNGYTCGLRQSREIFCWTWGNSDFGQDMPPVGTFSMLSTGSLHACALKEGGDAVCWGAGSDAELTGERPHYGQAIPPSGSFQSVSAGSWHSCGVRPDGAVECWGAGTTTDADCPSFLTNSFNCGQAAPPDGVYREVAVDSFHSCGVRTDGSVTCWGYDANARLDAPADLRVLE